MHRGIRRESNAIVINTAGMSEEDISALIEEILITLKAIKMKEEWKEAHSSGT